MDIIYFNMRAGSVACQGAIEVAQGDSWFGVDGSQKTTRETIGQIYAHILTPRVRMTSLIGVGSCDKQTVG